MRNRTDKSTLFLESIITQRRRITITRLLYRQSGTVVCRIFDGLLILIQPRETGKFIIRESFKIKVKPLISIRPFKGTLNAKLLNKGNRIDSTLIREVSFQWGRESIGTFLQDSILYRKFKI